MSPVLGRFLQRDLSGRRLRPSLYELFASRPADIMDPYGLRELTSSEAQLVDGVVRTVKDGKRARTLAVTYSQWRPAIERYHRDALMHIEDAVRQLKEEIRSIPADEEDPVRISALLWALRQYIHSPEAYSYDERCPSLGGSVSAFPKNTWKCNKFVADSYAHGAGVGLSFRRRKPGYPARRTSPKEGSSRWPPLANELADPDTSLWNLTPARDVFIVTREHGRIVKIKWRTPIPRPGDIVPYRAEVGSGHSSLYLGAGLQISAKGWGVEIGGVAYEASTHAWKARVRQYIED